MSFKTLEINSEYRSGKNDVVNEFLIPVLNNASSYKRAVGFFSSSALIEITKGLTNFIKNDGKISLIVSPNLTDEDIEAIEKGYEDRKKIIENSIMRDFSEPKNYFQQERLNILSHMIANGSLDIKVAFMSKNKKIGIYHEKLGLFYDEDNNMIAFSGSTNESMTAFKLNYETIDVFRSWGEDNFERQQALKKERAFNELWNNEDSEVEILEFPEVAKNKIQSYNNDTINYNVDKEELNFSLDSNDFNEGFIAPKDVNFYDYQKDAVNNWINHGCRGIFDMATGTGKTFTALYALSELNKLTNSNFAVIIVAPYQHLVEQWVEDINNFGVDPIIAYSDATYKKWKDSIVDNISAYNAHVIKFFCIVTTNATFATDFFQEQINKIKFNLCLVADEAHNFGAENMSKKLPSRCKYRLALSATIERFRDEKGTQKIKDFFGEICQSFTLEDAIKNNYLTHYYYYPILVELNDEELEEYQDITRLIQRLGGGSKENCEKNPTIEKLLIKRSRIIAGARNKEEALIKAIKPFIKDNHMLVYCGATTYDNKELGLGNDIRQIDEITKRLNQEYGIKVRKFTSEENNIDRKIIKEDFLKGMDLQVITAIKCLDEGVNIPAIKRAFILASSTNPKEYIQRRGRVLRKAGPEKPYAEIYDFITIPRPLDQVSFLTDDIKRLEKPLVIREIERMMDFAKSANNPFEIDVLKEKLLKAYGSYEFNMEDYYG